jgi:type IV fimbrial biogenesis protein FimT
MTVMAYRARRFGRAEGFTLMELMITIAVGAILLVLAVPNFVTALQKDRIGSAADQLYVSLAEARGEAVKRRRSVRVCPSADSASCRNDGDWSDGWLIFQDDDADGSPDASEIIKAVPSTSLADNVSLGCETAVDDFVEFGTTGATIDSGTSGAFWICHSNSNVPSREINVSLSGRIEDTTRAQTDCGATIIPPS